MVTSSIDFHLIELLTFEWVAKNIIRQYCQRELPAFRLSNNLDFVQLYVHGKELFVQNSYILDVYWHHNDLLRPDNYSKLISRSSRFWYGQHGVSRLRRLLAFLDTHKADRRSVAPCKKLRRWILKASRSRNWRRKAQNKTQGDLPKRNKKRDHFATSF